MRPRSQGLVGLLGTTTSRKDNLYYGKTSPLPCVFTAFDVGSAFGLRFHCDVGSAFGLAFHGLRGSDTAFALCFSLRQCL